MPDDNVFPSITLEELDISADKNFDIWLDIIKHTIYYLKKLNNDVNGNDGLQPAINEAIERNQITEYVKSLSEKDCNKYTKNGIYYIVYDSMYNSDVPLDTGYNNRQHLPSKSNYFVYVASLSEIGHLIQCAVRIASNTPAFYVRNGVRQSGTLTFSTWKKSAYEDWVKENYLDKVTTTAQSVNSPLTLNNNLTVNGDDEIGTNSLTVYGSTLLSGTVKIKQNEDPYHGIILTNTRNDFTIETNKGTHVNNSSQHTHEYMIIIPKDGNNENITYIEPLKIDYVTEICDINGTANYANFINPDNMVTTFKPEELDDYSKNYPVTGSAVSDLYKFSQNTYMPLSGGNFSGIVNHYEDIFLRHIENSQERRTAALRSPNGALNLQCQTTTNVISTSKQCELYLEKEDVNSAEYTKKEVSFSFSVYTVNWNKENIVSYNSEYSITVNGNTLTTDIGEIVLYENGNFTFNGNETLIRNIDSNKSYAITLYYRVCNKLNDTETIVSDNNEYTIRIDKNSGTSFYGTVTINASHYIVAFTKSNYEYLPIETSSLITAGSTITDGSIISANSVLGNYRYLENETVIGNKIIENSTVAGGTILKAGSIIAKNTIIHRTGMNDLEPEVVSTTFNVTAPLRSDIIIYTDNIENNEYTTILLPGSVIKSGSTIKSGSIINGVDYDEDKEINGLVLTQDLILKKGSSLRLETDIALGSVINSNYENGSYGVKVLHDSVIAAGSTLKRGSFVAPGSVIYSTIYENGYHLFTEEDSYFTTEDIQINTHSSLKEGSIIAVGSIIAGSSMINNISTIVKYTVANEDCSGEVTVAKLAPKMYVCEYNNVKDEYSKWIEYSYDKIYQNTDYNEDLWKTKLIEIIDNFKNSDFSKTEIKNDLDRILASEDLNRQVLNDLFNKTQIIRSGKYIASKTAFNNPQNLYDEYVYISSLDKSISFKKIEFQITSVNPAKSYVIYANNNSNEQDTTIVIPPISTDTFTYSDFDVRRIGSTYTVSFKYMLAKSLNQYDESATTFYENIRFNIYTGDNEEPSFSTTDYRLSFDANHMMNSACVIGARTRTGITKEGEFGDPLYDLGCVEFGEQYTAIRLRKQNVTTLQNVNPEMAVILQNSPRIAFRPEYIEYTNINQISNNYSYTTGQNRSGMISLGTPDSKFDTIYISSSSMTTSDRTQKTNIKDIPNKLLDAWKDVKWITYKLKDSVDKKGKNARIHTGVIAQDVETALSKVDLEKYGFFCKDKWDDEYETKTITIPKHTDSLGIEREERIESINVLTKKKGEQYSIRYQEMQAIENMYLRREIELLKEEIKSLKEKIK